MKKILTMICLAATICFIGCKDKTTDTQSVEKDITVLLQEDIDNSDAKQMVVDLGDFAGKFTDLAKTDAAEGKLLLEKVQKFQNDHQADIDKLTADYPDLKGVVEKIKGMDPEAVSKMKDKLK